jgi:putative spermidine/putrescine transport system permease protein
MRSRLSPYLQVAPLTAILGGFFVLPIVIVIMVSFFEYQTYQLLIPTFTLQNYLDVFASSVTYRTYLITLRFCAIVWAITLVLGFAMAYFLAFHVRTLRWQLGLFLLCTIPFWTSNVIRMIAWIPLLGRHGVVNTLLHSLGMLDAPLEWLLYSEFAVMVGYVHLYTLCMMVPIFNAMMRIDRAVLEAAVDGGATEWQTLWHVIVPLCKSGMTIGSIFVLAVVMGDFVTIDVLGGGQIASVGKAIMTELSYLQFPPAAANAMVLLMAVCGMIVVLLRVVDIQKEL